MTRLPENEFGRQSPNTRKMFDALSNDLAALTYAMMYERSVDEGAKADSQLKGRVAPPPDSSELLYAKAQETSHELSKQLLERLKATLESQTDHLRFNITAEVNKLSQVLTDEYAQNKWMSSVGIGKMMGADLKQDIRTYLITRSLYYLAQHCDESAIGFADRLAEGFNYDIKTSQPKEHGRYTFQHAFNQAKEDLASNLSHYTRSTDNQEQTYNIIGAAVSGALAAGGALSMSFMPGFESSDTNALLIYMAAMVTAFGAAGYIISGATHSHIEDWRSHKLIDSVGTASFDFEHELEPIKMMARKKYNTQEASDMLAKVVERYYDQRRGHAL